MRLQPSKKDRVALLLVLLAAISPVFGQGDTIEEIQVTATRRPVMLNEVSAAVTVITTKEIARTKLVTDSLAAKPGVFLQQTTPGQGAAIIRGLKGSEVLHLVDGMRLNNAIFRNAPTQYLALVSPGTLDRLEVVRGAPASLYGSDAVGGVILDHDAIESPNQICDRAISLPDLGGAVLGQPVVLAHEDDGQGHHAGGVETLPEDTFVQRAVAEEGT